MRISTTRTLAIGLIAIATALAPAATATAVPAPGSPDGAAGPPVGQDLRSPDTRDAAEGYAPTLGQDLRSPDTRDAAEGYAPTLGQDLRSPDTRDAAEGYAPTLASPAPSPSPSPAEARGLDWVSAAIGAGGVGGLLLALLGAVWAWRLAHDRTASARRGRVLGA